MMKQRKSTLDLARAISNLEGVGQVVLFLKGILTPGELSDIEQRLQIVKLLKKGTTQRVIAKKLRVGVATITRGSKELQKGRFENV